MDGDNVIGHDLVCMYVHTMTSECGVLCRKINASPHYGVRTNPMWLMRLKHTRLGVDWLETNLDLARATALMHMGLPQINLDEMSPEAPY